MDILDKIPKKNEELAWRTIDNETVIVPLDEQSIEIEKLNFLNKTGTEIWKLIDGNSTIREIIEKIHRQYDIEYKKTKEEILDFIKEVKIKNLIIIY